MVKAWYLGSELYEKDSYDVLTTDDVTKKTGVQLMKMDVDSYKDDSRFQKVIEEKKLFFSDVYHNSDDCTEEQVQFLLQEHIHEDDEVRLVLDGACCMDVRDKDDKWIRLRLTKGDMVVLPPGLYHRGLIDEYLQMLRMFESKELWIAVYRPAADDSIVHKKYLESRRAIEAN